MSGGQVDSSCTRGVMRTGSLPTWFPHCASTSLVTVMTDRLTDRQNDKRCSYDERLGRMREFHNRNRQIDIMISYGKLSLGRPKTSKDKHG